MKNRIFILLMRTLILLKLVRIFMLNTNDAVAKRISVLLKERGMTQYYLEQKSGVYHGAMNRILQGKNKTINLTTIYKIANGFGLSIVQFFDDEVLSYDNIEIE